MVIVLTYFAHPGGKGYVYEPEYLWACLIGEASEPLILVWWVLGLTAEIVVISWMVRMMGNAEIKG